MEMTEMRNDKERFQKSGINISENVSGKTNTNAAVCEMVCVWSVQGLWRYLGKKNCDSMAFLTNGKCD